MTPTPYYDDGQTTIYCGDCRDILPTLEAVDLVLTDPPYGLGDKWKGKRDNVWKLDRAEVMEWDGKTSDVVTSLPAIASNCIIWGGNYYPLPPVRGWLAWDKMQKHSGSEFELAWTNLSIPTRTFRLSRVEAYSKGKVHPTQKPISLIDWCLTFTPNAQSVLDPFMGSGTTIVAARKVGRRAIGIELEEKYCEIAVRRLQQAVLPLEIAS